MWNAKSKIGSLENASHKPKGGDKKIESIKLDFKDKAKPKVGSKDNLKHQPGGGDIKVMSMFKIETFKEHAIHKKLMQAFFFIFLWVNPLNKWKKNQVHHFSM